MSPAVPGFAGSSASFEAAERRARLRPDLQGTMRSRRELEALFFFTMSPTGSTRGRCRTIQWHQRVLIADPTYLYLSLNAGRNSSRGRGCTPKSPSVGSVPLTTLSVFSSRT